MKTTATRYTAIITRKDGSKFMSCGDGAFVKIFQHRADALVWADALAANGVVNRRRIKVVRIKLTAEEA